jgi:2-oxoglutarate ferredoxin oxidoreductase subunit alpha
VQRERCKNFFALGLLSWLWQLDQDGVEIEIKKTFAKANETCLANLTAFRAGLAHGIHLQQGITPISLPSNPGIKEKRISTDGNQAMVAALLMASQKSKRQLFFGGYPITPASSILEKLSQCSAKSVHVFQGEDEIAAIGAALGAAYGGALAATATSGPGFVLKQEFINFAVMAELPLVIINVQRAGPSTGMPTKTEQSDLNCALYGRNGDSPLVVLAARSPVDCFDTCYEAARIAIKYMTPVIVLSDSFLATSAETWSFPDWNTLEDFPLVNVQGKTDDTSPFLPYARDPKTLARAWIEPGEVGHTHRIGGLEKGGESGDVSYDPLNHQKMTELRAQKIANIAKELPKTEVIGNGKSDVLVVCWGSSYGAFCEAAKKLYDHPLSFACIAPQCLNPLPLDLGDILSQFATVIVAEQNYGQLVDIIRAKYLRPCHSFTKIQGRPFTFVEIKSFLQSLKAPQNSSEGDVS